MGDIAQLRVIQAMIRGVTSDQRSRSRWDTFAGWHHTEQLWRDIYTRTVSALIAALVIYLVAALSGLVSRAPLPWLCLLGALFTAWLSGTEVRGLRRGDEYSNLAGAAWFAGAALVFVAFAVYAWVR